jgi:hypothetical protein
MREFIFRTHHLFANSYGPNRDEPVRRQPDWAGVWRAPSPRLLEPVAETDRSYSRQSSVAASPQYPPALSTRPPSVPARPRTNGPRSFARYLARPWERLPARRAGGSAERRLRPAYRPHPPPATRRIQPGAGAPALRTAQCLWSISRTNGAPTGTARPGFVGEDASHRLAGEVW